MFCFVGVEATHCLCQDRVGVVEVRMGEKQGCIWKAEGREGGVRQGECVGTSRGFMPGPEPDAGIHRR